MEDQIIKISNFKLSNFRNLLNQSLIVNSQIMLEISSDMIKSCSFSSTKSFMKLWTIPLAKLIHVEESEDLEFSPQKQETLNFQKFNVYIMKGDIFSTSLSVHSSETVDLEFIVRDVNGKLQGACMIITGRTENNSPLKTNFVLTTEEMLSNKIDDYSEVIKECTPSPDMFNFILNNSQIQEIKRLIKKLHKSTGDNVAYLTFLINPAENKITVNDKIFSVDFILSPDLLIQMNLPTEECQFNILKSDFVMTGNHTFTIFANNHEQKVIFGATFASSIVWCLSSKIGDGNINLDESASVLDSTMEALDIAEYVDNF